MIPLIAVIVLKLHHLLSHHSMSSVCRIFPLFSLRIIEIKTPNVYYSNNRNFHIDIRLYSYQLTIIVSSITINNYVLFSFAVEINF